MLNKTARVPLTDSTGLINKKTIMRIMTAAPLVLLAEDLLLYFATSVFVSLFLSCLF
jgi:hypothetical protein